MMRDEAIKQIYKAVRGRAPFNLEEFVHMLTSWEVTPLYDRGELIGGVLSKDNELHVGCGERPRTSTRRYIKETLNQTIDKYGFAITSVQAQNSVGLRFCERLGFVKVGEANGAVLLRCDRSNYK